MSEQRILTARDIFNLYMDASQGEPAISYWGRQGPPPCHRADCNPRDITSGRCKCELLRIETTLGRDAAFETWQKTRGIA